ncbi:hypothetical protein TNCV_4389571 [Trichonephila clavipes]|nr:hypothetical protein TNCV_4389571 [Trichonephila clavipes]
MWAMSSYFGLSTTPIPREVLNSIEDELQFENALTALYECSERKDDDVCGKETSLNGDVELSFKLYEDTLPNNSTTVRIPVPEVDRARGDARTVLTVIVENTGKRFFRLGKEMAK